MIKLKVKIKSLSGDTYTSDTELHDDYMISRKNEAFLKLISDIVEKSHLEEMDTVKVTANLGEM